MSNSLIEARGINISYTSGKLFDRLDLSLSRGRLAALIGANGSGKSTLLKLLCGLEQPDSGAVEIDGKPIHSMSRTQVARRIAYVAQNAAMIFPFTSLEVVLTGRNPHLGSLETESRADLEIALDALAQVGASHLAERPVTTLSGGEQQLVFVARAIAQQPELLLLDEPGSSLDLKHRAQLVRVLRRLRDERGIASLVVTHDLMFLEPSFDEVLALCDGSVVVRGSPGEILCAQTLKEVYSVAIHTLRQEGRIFVWSEV
jgi:iron complex transport system ATP-binding protein